MNLFGRINKKVSHREKTKLLMTEGSEWKILIRFSIPLFLGNLFQQLYNAVDSLVVGNFCGNEALAAVSSSGSLSLLLIGFFQGVFVGASVIISKCFGARDQEGVDRAVHTTVVFSVIAGILLTILGVIFTPGILKLMGTPKKVLPNSIVYFRIYSMGFLGMVLYNTTNGIFNALGNSKYPLYYLMISSAVNVILDLLFVGVFHMGVGGAALATVLGQTLSAVLGLLHLMSGRFVIQICWSKLKIHPKVLKQVFVQGIPSGIQNSVTAIANLVVQANINEFGSLAMAGCGSYAKIQGFVFLPITSLTLALTTFVSQNMGAGKTERIQKGMKQGIFLCMAMAELFGVCVFFFGKQMLGIFSEDALVIGFGVRQAKIESLFYFLLAFTHACGGILRGAGKSMTPMGIMLGVWCVFRIIYITCMVRLIPNITVVFTAYPVTWLISSLLLFVALKRERKEIS